MAPTILWFRRDLRCGDHPAVAAAVRDAGDDGVVGAFCLDPALLASAGAVRRAYLARLLGSLDEALGGRLVLVDGAPADVLPRLVAATGAGTVHVSADHGPYGAARDRRTGDAIRAAGARFVASGSPYAIAPGTVRTTSGTGYARFTPFWRSWRAHGWPPPVVTPEVSWCPIPDGVGAQPSAVLGTLAPAGVQERVDAAIDAAGGVGETAALDRLDVFLAERIDDYDTARDRPGLDATSHLSADLRWGTIHPRTILARLAEGPGAEVFAKELCWREFYADVLHRRPESAHRSLDPRTSTLRWDDGAAADERFDRWRAGRTGYPLVDAGMRQLLAEGWMHNRVRMVTASFLVKDLHLDWRRGAQHFLDHLIDGDLASNQHGWQWTAGTGTDAAPFFRIFNPVAQSRRFDPDGTYLRRYLPELRGVAADAIHEPWRAPGGPPEGYPAPIVDHAEERAEALARYAETRR